MRISPSRSGQTVTLTAEKGKLGKLGKLPSMLGKGALSYSLTHGPAEGGTSKRRADGDCPHLLGR